MDLTDPSLLLPEAPRVAEALDLAGWSSPALDDLLGVTAQTHLDRGELACLLRRTTGGSALEVLARLFVLGVPVEPAQARVAGVPESWLSPDGTALVGLQPVLHDGADVTVPHDPSRGPARVQPEQVLGVGAAALTLAAATPRRPVARVLDLGAGGGIQALLARRHADAVVATDRNPRAVAFTRLAAALAGSPPYVPRVEQSVPGQPMYDVREGDLLEPVAGEAFDLIVSNPPFVISPGRRYTYRDAGYPGDEVCRRLVAGLPGLLVPGGTAVLLANWLHLPGQDGDDRVRSWFDGTGADGWIVQRELAVPEDYVTAWLRDTDEGRGSTRCITSGWPRWTASTQWPSGSSRSAVRTRPARAASYSTRSTSRWPRPGARRCSGTSTGARRCRPIRCAWPGGCGKTYGCARTPSAAPTAGP